MIAALLVLGIISAWGVYHFLKTGKKTPTAPFVPTCTDIRCPSCNALLHIEGMLDSAIFFVAGAIVFDCSDCHDRVYFAPYDDNIEVGTLGCSPVVDTMPHECYAYPPFFEMKSSIQDGILNIEIKDKSWKIPLYGLWNKKAGISCPKPAVKGSAKGSASHLISQNHATSPTH